MSFTSAQTPTGNDRSRWLAFAGTLAIAGVVAYRLAGFMWASVAWRLGTDGFVCAAWLLAGAGYGAWILRSLRISSDSRALCFCTSAALGLGLISLVSLGLGLAGALNLPVAVGIVGFGVVLFIAHFLKYRSTRPVMHGTAPMLWVLIGPTLGIAITASLVLPGLLWGVEPLGYDVLEYHFQIPREWFELGRIAPLSHNVFSYFPFNVEMHYLLAMHLYGGPWNAMYLAQLMHLTFIGLTVASVYGIVRSLSSPVMAILAALLVAGVPWMTMLGSIGYNEGGLLLFGTLAMGWTIHASRSQTRRLPTMALAGAMAGFACGVKLTAVPMVLIAIPVAAVVLFKKQIIKPAFVFFLASLVTFSPWLIRNTVWISNPVFPEATSVFGESHFDESQVARWHAAHDARPDQQNFLGRAAALWNGVLGDWRFGWLLFQLAVVAIVLARKDPTSAFLLILLLIQLVVWLGFTHLQGRFFVLAIPIVGIVAGLFDSRFWRAAVGVGIIACVATSVDKLSPIITEARLTIDSDNYRQLIDQSIYNPGDSARIFNHNGPVIMIGEARAFEYDISMRQLRYRTVFDIAASQGSAIEAWAGGPIPADALLVINPSEIRRLERTYTNLPKLPVSLVPEGITALVIRADELPK